MGKGTRKRLDRQEERQKQEEVAAAQQKAAGRKRLVWIATAIVAVLVIVAIVLLRIRADVRRQNGDAIRETVAMSSEHYTVDGAMMSYFIHSELSAYVRENANTVTLEGLDPEADLKTQTCTAGNTGAETWFDYFADAAMKDVRYYLYLAEGANEAGLTLSDDDVAHIDSQIQLVRDEAKAKNQSLDEFIAANFGQGVNLDDIRRAIELQMIGSKLRGHVEADVASTDADLQAYYEGNSARLNSCDLYTITFVSSIQDGFTDEQISAYNAGTRVWADGLALCHDVDSFRAYLDSYYRQYYEEQGQAYDDAEIKASIDNNASLLEGFTYTGDTLSEWALDPSRQVGDTTVIEGENEYSVYLITKAPTRLDYKTKTFRQIKLGEESYETAIARRDKINELRDTFAAGEQTEAAFAALAEQNNDDKTDQVLGGLHENARRDDVDEKVREWLFEDGRKAGDVRIIKDGSDNYYLIYYVGEGEPCWKVTAAQQLKTAAYDDAYNKLAMNTNVTVDPGVISKLPG